MEPSPPRSYALGHSAQELDRLRRQAEAFGPFTRVLFQQAGIVSGMRILDVGSGSGDVAFLAAEMAGPAGEVIGTDLAPAAVEHANARAQSRGAANVRFHCSQICAHSAHPVRCPSMLASTSAVSSPYQ